jgi:hypothetical protein
LPLLFSFIFIDTLSHFDAAIFTPLTLFFIIIFISKAADSFRLPLCHYAAADITPLFQLMPPLLPPPYAMALRAVLARRRHAI